MTSIVVWEPVTSIKLDIRHPYYGQFTAVNSLSAVQNHVTVSWAQVPTHQGLVFFGFPLTSF